MNFKDWEKVSEDKKTTKLKHKNGHFMVIIHKELPKLHQEALKLLKFSKGRKVPKEMAKDEEVQHFDEGAAPIQSAGDVTSQVPPEPMQSSGVATPPAPAPGPSLEGEAQRTLNAENAGLQGIEGQKGVDIEKAKAIKEMADKNVADQQSVLQYRGQALDDIQKHTQDLNDDIKNINPQHYQENQGTGQRVATGIGLFLGGFGVPFGGHNYAFDYLNKQIDRDIAAQEKNNENKKTVWGAWHQLYGDKDAATQLALATTKDLYARQVEAVAAGLGTPQAEAASNMAKAKWGADSADARMRAAAILGNKAHAASGSAAQNKNKYSLLSPDADQRMLTSKYNPLLENQIPQLQQQYTQAQQAEKLLNGPGGDGKGGIDDILDQMDEATQKAGYYGYAHKQVGKMGEALPLIGGAAGAAVNLVPPTHSEKRMAALKSSLETDLGTALNGIMTPTDIHNLVENYASAYQDTGKDKEFRKEQIVNTIKKALRSSSLGAAGMLPKEK